jgi:hypothetical protein
MIPQIPKNLTQKEVFAWLKENEDDILYAKKSEFKTMDFQAPSILQTDAPLETYKGISKGAEDSDPTEIKVRAIINTTMVRDSHKDVHINGIWNKSLKENTRIKFLQEHKMTFDSVIADKDDLKAFTKKYDWKQLGYDVEGKTEALVFDATIKQSRNPIMFKEYKDGNVDNHSVGMYYVEMKMGFNSKDEDDEAYKLIYDKYIDDIANKEEVKKDGFFFAVTQAKVIEGSAVPMGSNPITPTLSTSKDTETLTAEQIKMNAIKKWLSE